MVGSDGRRPVGRMLWMALFLLLASAAGSGCIAPGPEDGDVQEDPDAPFMGVDESAEPVDVAFEVFSRAGGSVEVAGRLWAVPDAQTAVLMIHGSTGRSERFGPAVVPGYSLADVMTQSGRTAVTIDLPGYGATPANGYLVGMEDYAFVIDQVAQALRNGKYSASEPQAHGNVVALGVSMGGLLTDLTQGLFASFDGIIPTVWSHGRYSEGAARCYSTGECPEDPLVWGYHLENVDPAIIGAARNYTGGDEMPFGVGYSLWWNCWSCWAWELRPVDDMFSTTLRPDRVTATIDVPVLSILAEEDFFFEKEDLPDQGEYYPRAASFELILLEDTGHAWALHLNRLEVHEQILTWMVRHGF